jgi:hypothetical protein
VCVFFRGRKNWLSAVRAENNGVGSWTEVSIVEGGEVGTSQKMLLLKKMLLNKIARAGAVALL